MVQMKEMRVIMRQSVSKGQRLSEGFARREGSVKKINLKVRVRVGRG